MDVGGETLLVIAADDFGMCASVNAGIVSAFRRGAITQASMMAPAPAFAHAAALAREHRIPCAVHLTLGSEWDRVRWSPLTGDPRLTGRDGMLPAHPAALADVAGDVVERELRAQVDAILAVGVRPRSLDTHIALVREEAVAEISRAFDLPCRDFLACAPECSLAFTSVLSLSPIPAERKAAALANYIGALDPGAHLVIAHPALAGRDLDELCSEAWPERRRWATSYRVGDLDALTDPSVARSVRRAGARLVTADRVPRVRSYRTGEGAKTGSA